jgi:hypothetical protein
MGRHSKYAVYVGWTRVKGGIAERFWQHYMEQKRPTDDSLRLQQDMKAYGANNFVIYGLECVPFTAKADVPFGHVAQHKRREQFWISRLDSIRMGYNRRREIRVRAHNSGEHRTYKHRNYGVLGTHLLNHWIATGESLADTQFERFRDKRLLAYIAMWYNAPSHSPARRLSSVILRVMQRRIAHRAAVAQRVVAARRAHKGAQVVVILPFSSKSLESVPLQRLINSKALSRLSPADSILCVPDVVVYYRYAQPNKLRACNYHDQAHSECICDTAPYRDFIDPDHKHVLTADLNMIAHLPELQELLSKGTAFKSAYCFDFRDLNSAMQDAVSEVITKAMQHDGLPKAAYGPWRQALLHTLTPYVQRAAATLLHNTHTPPGNTRTHGGSTHTESVAAARRIDKQLHQLQQSFIITTTDKAVGCFSFMCKRFYTARIQQTLSTATYCLEPRDEVTISNYITERLQGMGITTDLLKNPVKQHGRTVYDVEPAHVSRFFLTLKAHKSPQGLRGVASIIGTAVAAGGRLAVKLLRACIPVFDDIWRRVALHCGILSTGSWILEKSADLMPRLHLILSNERCRHRPFLVLDFTSMYDKFVQHDMKRQLRHFLHMVFRFQDGHTVLNEADNLGPFSRIATDGDARYRTLQVTFKSRYKGKVKVNDVTWSPDDVGDLWTHERDGLRYDADGLADLVDFCIDNAYIAYRDTVYRQRTGLAMGLQCSPQIANIYCGLYELLFMTRCARRFQHYGRPAPIQPFLHAMFNGSRLIDDIGLAGVDKSPDELTALMCDTRQTTDGSAKHDGVYPAVVTDHDGTLISNPMQLNLERQGLCCAFLDLLLTFLPDGSFSTTIYQKRDAMPVFKGYRRFPHIDSVLSDRSKYGVFASQLHRFAVNCSTLPKFGYNVKRLLKEMVLHGYNYARLRTLLRRFWGRYDETQRTLYHLRQGTSSRKRWSQLVRACDKLARSCHRRKK